jgi:hypothetical protein
VSHWVGARTPPHRDYDGKWNSGDGDGGGTNDNPVKACFGKKWSETHVGVGEKESGHGGHDRPAAKPASEAYNATGGESFERNGVLLNGDPVVAA